MAKPIPDGYHSVTPYLVVTNAAEAIEFYKKALGATEVLRMTMPGGSVAHAEIKIGDSHVMLGDECAQWGALSATTLGGSPVGLCVYVPDVDVSFAQAVAAGANVKQPVTDQFYGDRSGTIVDPYGHKWTLATHKEDLSPAELQQRMDAFVAQMQAPAQAA